MRLHRRALLAGLMVATPAFAQTPSQTQTAPMPIYGDRLAPGWESWSWAEVVLGVRGGNEERPIQISADAWEALYLHHAPFDTAGYASFCFWINGGAGGQALAVVAMDERGEAMGDSRYAFTPPANEWRRIEVPLSAIGGANTRLSGFLIQNAADATAPAFFVNEVGLF